MGARGLGKVIVPYVCFQNWLEDAERLSNDACLPYVPYVRNARSQGPTGGSHLWWTESTLLPWVVTVHPNTLKREIHC